MLVIRNDLTVMKQDGFEIKHSFSHSLSVRQMPPTDHLRQGKMYFLQVQNSRSLRS